MNNNSNYVLALEISFQLKSLCILLVHTVTETKRRTEKQEAVRDSKPSKAAHSLGTIVCLGEWCCIFYILLFALLKPILIYLIYAHHFEQKYFVSIFIHVDIIHV